jgi:hypothetical protein
VVKQINVTKLPQFMLNSSTQLNPQQLLEFVHLFEVPVTGNFGEALNGTTPPCIWASSGAFIASGSVGETGSDVARGYKGASAALGTGHGIHLSLPPVAYVPSGHAIGTEVFSGHSKPAGQ